MLSLIVTPEKQEGRTRLKKVLRDVSENEFNGVLAEYGCDPAIPVARAEYTEERGKISVIAPIKCAPKTPKSMTLKAGSKKIQYRGPIIVAGAGTGEDDECLPSAFYKGLKIEPAYGDDAICIPSAAEWQALPTPLGNKLRERNWIWLRGTAPGHQALTYDNLEAGGGYRFWSGTVENGGIVSFVNLNKLPAETADKIRANTTSDGYARFNVHFGPLVLFRITNDTYAIGAYHRVFSGMLDRWLPFFKNTAKEDCYDNSFIRKYLNEAYLPKLIERIDAYPETK